jgi:uncharacterized repeat protein (TIGR01451 family)
VLLPDLTISKEASNLAPAVGQEITYTLTVSNAGNLGSGGTSLVDPVPADTSFVAASTGCFLLSGNVNCPVPALAPGEAQVYTFSVEILAVGSITNTAVVDPGFDIDESNEFNNTGSVTVTAGPPLPTSTPSSTPTRTVTPSATATPTVTGTLPTATLTPTVTLTSTPTSTATSTATITRTPTVTPTTLPDLIVTKSASPGTAVAGDLLTYTLTVSNQGAANSVATTLSDQIPVGTTFSSGSAACGLAVNVFTCNVLPLGPGAFQTFTLVVTVTATSGGIVNIAVVDPLNAVVESNETNNSVALTVAVVTPTASTPSLTPTRTPTATSPSTVTNTPTITATPLVGGRGFTLFAARAMSWSPGNQEVADVIARWGPNSGFTFLPIAGPLPGSASSFTDVTAVADQAYCYLLALFNGLPPGGGTFIGQSDLLCVYPNSGTGTQPGAFSVRLDQGQIATLSWTAPQGVNWYTLTALTFDGSAPRSRILSPGLTSVTDDTLGKATCYVLEAQSIFGAIGKASTLCAVPHIATVSGASAAGGSRLPGVRFPLEILTAPAPSTPEREPD